MKSRSIKQKGHNFELEVAKMLRDSGLDKNSTRMIGSGAFQGFLSDIKTDLPISIECKRQEKTSFHEWYEQARAQSNSTKIPIVVWRRNHDVPYAYLNFNDFLEILKFAVDGGFKGKLPFAK